MLKKLAKSKSYQKVRDHCYYTDKYRSAAHSICNLRCIPIVFHNGSNYDYIIKELAKDFEEKFELLGENTEKYKTIFVPIAKRIYKN